MCDRRLTGQQLQAQIDSDCSKQVSVSTVKCKVKVHRLSDRITELLLLHIGEYYCIFEISHTVPGGAVESLLKVFKCHLSPFQLRLKNISLKREEKYMVLSLNEQNVRRTE